MKKIIMELHLLPSVLQARLRQTFPRRPIRARPWWPKSIIGPAFMSV